MRKGVMVASVGTPLQHYRTPEQQQWTKDTCPDRDRRHTKCPDGYIAWHEWAEKKMVRHEQTICPTCGLYAIWKRKKK